MPKKSESKVRDLKIICDAIVQKLQEGDEGFVFLRRWMSASLWKTEICGPYADFELFLKTLVPLPEDEQRAALQKQFQQWDENERQFIALKDREMQEKIEKLRQYLVEKEGPGVDMLRAAEVYILLSGDADLIGVWQKAKVELGKKPDELS